MSLDRGSTDKAIQLLKVKRLLFERLASDPSLLEGAIHYLDSIDKMKLGQPSEYVIIPSIGGGGTTYKLSPSYTVYIDDSYYCAMDADGNLSFGGSGNAGGVDGTDARAVIQACMDALPNGGLILIKVGLYIVYNIEVKASINIEGEGEGTHLKLPNNAPDHYRLFEMGENSDYARIANMQLDGNKANMENEPEIDYHRHGIATKAGVGDGCSYAKFEKLWIHDFSETGIDTAFMHNTIISKNFCWNNGDGGIWLDYTGSDEIVEGNLCWNNGIGIMTAEISRTTYARIIKGNIAYSNTGHGICVHVSQDVVLTDNIVYNNTEHGILVDSGLRVLVANNYAFDNEEVGIMIGGASDNILVTGNQAGYNAKYKTQNWGIYVTSGVLSAYVVNNRVWGNVAGQIGVETSNAIVKFNDGFLTDKLLENVTVNTSSTTIPHGLDVTPNSIRLIPRGDARVWRSADPDATNIYLQASSQVACDIYVSKE